LGSSQDALDRVMSTIRGATPASTAFVRDILADLVRSRGALGIIGISTLLWVGSEIVVTLENAMNVVWEVEARPFWKSRLLAIGVTMLMIVLGLSSIAATWVMAAVRGKDIWGVGNQAWLWTLAGIFLPAVLGFGLFLLFYKLLPNTTVSWKKAAIGAAFAAIAWELAKQIFGFYLNNIANYSSLYGSLAGLVILIVWVYYSAIIILVGAEIVSMAQHKQDEAKHIKPPAYKAAA